MQTPDRTPPSQESLEEAKEMVKKLFVQEGESERRARRRQSGQFGKHKRKSAARVKVKR